MAKLDQNGQLLVCDGISGDYFASHDMMVSAFGGVRARLDDHSSFDERSMSQHLCSGASLYWALDDWQLRSGYRFEQIHRAEIGGTYFDDNLGLGLSTELLLSPSETNQENSSAVVIRFDGNWSSRDERFTSQWLILGQLGDDPRPYGRADFSLMPSQLDAGQMARLFLGTSDPHVRTHLDAQYWLQTWLSVQAGAFLRTIIDTKDVDSLRPQLTEFWLGPQVSTSRGFRAGVEAQAGAENAGEPSIFGNTGDAVVQRIGLRGYSEIPFILSEEMTLAIRPSILASWTNTDSALTRTENQARYAGGLIATWVWNRRAKVAARYEAEVLPSLGANSMTTVHRTELWIEGTY